MDYSEQLANISIVAHRGAGGIAPENTLAAIKKSLALGVKRIEIDIQQTNDNVLVVLHDKTINRTTTGKGLIRDKNYQELLKYSAGSHFSEVYQTEQIPSLEQVLECINGKAILVIDVKCGQEYYPNIEKRIIQTLVKHNAIDWCIIQSFRDDILNTFHSLSPDVRLSKLFIGKIPFLPIIYDHQFRIGDYSTSDFIEEISIHHLFVTKKIIKEVHQKNKKIFAWTVNNLKIANKLANMGIDGIETDFPNKYL